MRQSGDWVHAKPLDKDRFRQMLSEAIETLKVDQAQKEVEPFVKSPAALAVWSNDFFRDVSSRIRLV